MSSGNTVWNAICPDNSAGNSSPSVVWDPVRDDLTDCYKDIFMCSVHALFLVISAFYVGRVSGSPLATTWLLQLKVSSRIVTISWALRFLSSVCTLILLFLSFILQIAWLQDFPAYGLISYAQFSVSLLAWLVFSSLAWSATRSQRPTIDAGDSFTIFLAWIPVFIMWSLEFRSALLNHSPNTVHRAIAMAIFGCQALVICAAVLHVFSSCIDVRSPEKCPQLPTVATDSDQANLIDEMSEGPPPPKLGEPQLWGPLRFLLFLWVDPLMQYGAQGFIKRADDLFELPKRLKADPHAAVLQDALHQNPKTSQFYLPQTLFRLWGVRWFVLGMMKLAYSFLQYTSPLLVNLLVGSIEDPGSQPEYYGYLFGFGLITVNLISTTVQLHYVFQVEQLALCMRGALVDSVYAKLLRVHSSSLSDSMGSGQVVNLVGNDCQKVSENCQYLHQLWALPLQIGVALYLLYRQVGFSFIGGVIFTLLLVPLNQLLASKISKQVERNLKFRDARIKLMTEALNAIRVIKFHAWEKWFCERVGAVRKDEMRTVKTIKYLDALCVYFWATTPLIMSVMTFSTYALRGNQLTAAKVFTCMSVFGLVIVPLNVIPWIITGTVEAWISAKRLQKYFKLSEIDITSYYGIDEGPATDPSEPVIAVHDGSFTWIPEPETVTTGQPSQERRSQLRNVSVSIERGELVGIVGKVGSGKSSLLNAVVAEMFKSGGTVKILANELKHGFGFVPQDNWIQQGTVASNILFSTSETNPEFYKIVIDACALGQDLQTLPAGDLTEIGEHGVTLSGGQKARIALARAVFQDKDVVIMDDSLSAVDAQVANHIFDECVVKLLEGKTRLFVTHHVDFLRSADRILLMKDGNICQNGPPSEVLPNLPSFDPSSVAGSDMESEAEDDVSEEVSQPAKRKEPIKIKKEPGAQLIQDEQREFGTVKLSVYKQYWAAVGNFWAMAVFLSLFLMQASYNVNDWWLSYWVTHEKTTVDPATNMTISDFSYYLTVYGGIGAGNSFFALIRSFVFAYAGLRAAYHMHDVLLVKVMRGKMLFFDTTPSGRILNRFAKDITSVDTQLPFMVNIILACICQLVGTMVVICYGLPWFCLLLIPIAPLYYFIQRYYRNTSREIKRINTLTQSPIFTMYSETVQGLSTIRAMRATGWFYAKYRKLLDDNLRAQFAEISSSKWLNIRLEFLGMVIISGVVVIALLVKSGAGTLGLTVSYSLTVIGILNNFVTTLIETEKEMVSVERIMQYLSDIEEEKYDGICKVPVNWPEFGAVHLDGISLRYREDLPVALSKLTLNIKPAERIGVVGRTGAGKSSFLVTLFRMAEVYEGKIAIDGVDIAHLALEDLRSRLAIIPQTPSLFDASIRDNVDPLHKHTDAEIWAAIDMCDLRGAVMKLGGHLSVMLGENGRKLSLGQKQLVCLARALLTKAKILCLDEATASVDYETDQLIQRTLREAFGSSTIITIAHRLQTVMDYDRIVVMSDGKIVECDSPQNLLSRPSSHFFMLHQQSQRMSSAS